MSGLSEKTKHLSAIIQGFKALNLEEISISQYSKTYLGRHIKSIEYSLQLAWQILEEGLQNINKPIETISVLEIGGGTGIISLLALKLGFKNVVYSDTYLDCCLDFEKIAFALDIKPQGIVHGSIGEVNLKVNEEVDLIVSRDVVEHIYDLQGFFNQSTQYFPKAVMVHNTSANAANYFKSRSIQKIQVLDERYGNKNQIKPGDSQQSFYNMRLKYIQTHFSNLSSIQQEKLSYLSRGKNYDDIDLAVKKFEVDSIWPLALKHKNNTCDPANGNWTEHLLEIKEYESFFDADKYVNSWAFAPYNEWENAGIKKKVLMFLNRCIKSMGHSAKYISPAILLIAKPKN